MNQIWNRIRNIVGGGLNIVDFWWRIFLLFVPLELMLFFAMVSWGNPTAILAETFLIPLAAWYLLITRIRPTTVLIADGIEDLAEKIVGKLAGPETEGRMHRGFEGLLETARFLLGFRLLLGVALAFWQPKPTAPGDVPFPLAFCLALLALWVLRRTGLRAWAFRAVAFIVVITLFGGWLETKRTFEVIRYSVDTKSAPAMHDLFPGLTKTEKVAVKAGGKVVHEGEFTVPPGQATIWIDRPDTSYRFAWDVNRDFAPYLDTEREYIDGTREVKNCLVEETKPIARVRFIHRGTAISIPVKVWSKPLPS